MEIYTGEISCSGIAIGRIAELSRHETLIRRTCAEDPAAETARYRAAKAESRTELEALKTKAAEETGKSGADLFKAHIMLLDEFDERVENLILTQNVSAEYAVSEAGSSMAAVFTAMDDNPYMQARASDIKDLADRVIRALNRGDNSGGEAIPAGAIFTEKIILAADDLAPSETVQIDKEGIAAFVTREGSTNSHTAILARTMNIPALCQTPLPKEAAGKLGIVDGTKGVLYVDPDEETLTKYREKMEGEEKKQQLLAELKGKETVTRSGRKVRLCANISGIDDIPSALESDAAGIGLFRSEFLYLENDTFPSEEEQFLAYRTAAEKMAGREVVIRTLDIGSDKQISGFGPDFGENPALGCRAIRFCLTYEDIFRTQLRALYRASHYGCIAILIPMIISKWEVARVKEICGEVKAELDAQGLPYRDVRTGIMIETPAAVLMADELAETADFFSIGTNDLTQYTLAADRRNQRISRFFDDHHPAVLKAIRMTVEAAHRHHIPVSICGDLATDTALTETFVRMGIDELSMSPSSILPMRKLIREME